MEQTFIFIYARKGKIKALNFESAKILEDKLLKDGWVHTATLDPCIYFEFLHNDCKKKDLIKEVERLSNYFKN